MAVTGGDDNLERAVAAAREADIPEWPALSASILSRVRRLVRSAESVATFPATPAGAAGDRGSTVSVSVRVLVQRIAQVVSTATRSADDVVVTVQDGRCAAVRIDLVCALGTDLLAEGDAAQEVAVDVLAELLGTDPAFDGARDVSVRIVDVVEGDPRQT